MPTTKKGVDLQGTKHARYYAKNKASLREKARKRMAEYRRRQKFCHRNSPEGPEQGSYDASSRSDGETSPLAQNFDDSAVEDDVNRLTPFTGVGYFQDASKNIHDWLGEWGGLDAWPRHLDEGYNHAHKKGGAALDAWVRAVLDHADRGRLLAKLLGQMEYALPREMWRIRELWRQQTILVGLVMKGLALIEIRVDILQSGSFNLIQ